VRSREERWLAGTILLLLLATGAAPLWGIEGNELAPLGEKALGKSLQKEDWNRNAPVDIHSEEMSVDFENNKIVFKGDVKVLQSDFSLTAGEVTAFFGESADDIKKIVASDVVKRLWAD
jgi:lipopolysaccharide assembly outer membrane protein LptD (OstA)